MEEFYRALLELIGSGRPCATATLVDAVGSTPAKRGHRMIVLPDRTTLFTIGGGPLEAMVIDDCLAQLAESANAVREYRLLPDDSGGIGMVCGGTARVFIEIHPATETLLVFGAGHVGREVIRVAEGLGLRRVVADDRAEYLDAGRFDPDVARVHCPASFAGDLPRVDERTHVVIVTRCHATDREILARLAGARLAYLGMIGSRRKVATVLAELDRRGVPRHRFEQLRAPIGLEIGAQSPREIALAIVAEIVAERNASSRAVRLPRAKSVPLSRRNVRGL